MLEEIFGLISNIGEVAQAAGNVIDVVQKVKGLMQENNQASAMFGQMPPFGQPIPSGQPSPSMPSFSPTMPPMMPFQPQMQDPFQGGNQWLPQLSQIAQQFGNGWVPQQTQSLMGINLTGVWCPPMNFYDQTYIRQYGPYINIIAGVNGMPTVYAEGVFNPSNRMVVVVGKNMQGAMIQSQCQLLPNWVLQGSIAVASPWGMPMQYPIYMNKMA